MKAVLIRARGEPPRIVEVPDITPTIEMYEPPPRPHDDLDVRMFRFRTYRLRGWRVLRSGLRFGVYGEA